MSGLGDFWAPALRHRCKLRLVTGYATDGAASAQAGLTSPCGECPGCDLAVGHLGNTSNGARIFGLVGGYYVEWDCPGCGGDTAADCASPLDAERVAIEEMADPLCYRCRAKTSHEERNVNG